MKVIWDISIKKVVAKISVYWERERLELEKKNKEENRIKKREERKKWKKKEIQIFQFWESFKIWNLPTQPILSKIPEKKRNKWN